MGQSSCVEKAPKINDVTRSRSLFKDLVLILRALFRNCFSTIHIYSYLFFFLFSWLTWILNWCDKRCVLIADIIWHLQFQLIYVCCAISLPVIIMFNWSEMLSKFNVTHLTFLWLSILDQCYVWSFMYQTWKLRTSHRTVTDRNNRVN